MIPQQLDFFGLVVQANGEEVGEDFDDAAEFPVFALGTTLRARVFLQASQGHWVNGCRIDIGGNAPRTVVRPISASSRHSRQDDAMAEAAIQVALLIGGLANVRVGRDMSCGLAFAGAVVQEVAPAAIRAALEMAGVGDAGALFKSVSGQQANWRGVLSPEQSVLDGPLHCQNAGLDIVRTASGRWLSAASTCHTCGSRASLRTPLMPFRSFGCRNDAVADAARRALDHERPFVDGAVPTVMASERAEAARIVRWAQELQDF